MFDKLDVKKATIVELESFFSDEIKGTCSSNDENRI